LRVITLTIEPLLFWTFASASPLPARQATQAATAASSASATVRVGAIR
jgi:hypothetical protein